MQQKTDKRLPDVPEEPGQLDILSPTEEQELTRLLSKLETGGLSKAEQRRLSEASPQSGGQIMVQMTMQSESFSGPLPLLTS